MDKSADNQSFSRIEISPTHESNPLLDKTYINLQADDKDSGIQKDHESPGGHNTTESNGRGGVESPFEEVAQNYRRDSMVSRQSTASTVVDPKDEMCGWGPFSPQFCQRFRNPKWVLVWLSMASLCQGMIVNGFVLTSISTLERRFDLKSSETGVIASGYDFASLICLIPVSYFGGVSRKPIWIGTGVLIMGLGSMLFMLPHLTVDRYIPRGAESDVDTCQRGLPNATEDCTQGLLSNYKYVFIFGQLLHGVGASPLYTLGVSYIDDNLLPATTSLFVGIFYSLSIVGPAIGFLLGGIFLNIYVNPSVDIKGFQITTDSPKWVGAWWIGFIIAGILSLIASIGLCAFPKYLPGRKDVQKLKVSEAHGGKGETSGFSGRLSEFPLMLKKLLMNPTFVFVSLAGTMEGLILSGFATFAPKFVQNQFSTTAAFASVIVGAIAVPAGGGGTFFGGWIIKKKNMKLKQIVKMCAIFAAVSFFLCFGYLIQCKNTRFAGVTHPYFKNESHIDLVHDCNRDCKCSRHLYNPVCGANNMLYLSPCYAGCSKYDVEITIEKKLYSSCDCIESMSVKDNISYSAIEGKCSSDCKLLPLFLLFFFGVTVFTFLASMPALSATLRSVPENQKSFALGIQWLMVRALGTIPAGPMIGKIIDLSCVLWQEECGEKGSCYAYDNEKMGINLMSAGLAVKFFSVLFLVLTYIVYKPPPSTRAAAEDQPQAEVDFLHTREDVSKPARPNNLNEVTEL